MGKTIVVTGSTDGIGKQTAIECAAAGHRVVVHGRNPDKGKGVLAQVRAASPTGDGVYCNADLASLAAVRDLATELRDAVGSIDVLINNAAVWEKRRSVTADGNELTLQVNYLAPFVLANALAPHLERGGRVVNVASLVHAHRLDLDNLQAQRRFTAWDAYARSKLYLIMFTFDLAARLKPRGITVNAVHPGVIETKMLRKTGAHGSPVTVGSRRLRFAALDPSLADTTGVLLVSDQPHDTHAVSRDRKARTKLRTTTETLTRP